MYNMEKQPYSPFLNLKETLWNQYVIKKIYLNLQLLTFNNYWSIKYYNILISLFHYTHLSNNKIKTAEICSKVLYICFLLLFVKYNFNWMIYRTNRRKQQSNLVRSNPRYNHFVVMDKIFS